MRKVRRLVAAVLAGAVVGAVVGPVAASGAVPAGESSPVASDGHWAPAPTAAVTPQAESGVITAGTCQYRQATANPRVVRGDTFAHGWWLTRAGACPRKATVTEYLQAYWCDRVSGCSWITVSSGRADVYARGGSAKQATARLTCHGRSTVGWRAYVDVDLDNWRDPSGYTYSPIEDLACSPP